MHGGFITRAQNIQWNARLCFWSLKKIVLRKLLLPGAYIVIHKLLVCNKFYDQKVLWLLRVHWSTIMEIGKILPNRLYLLIALSGLVQIYVFFCISSLTAFILVIFKKQSNKECNDPVVKNKHSLYIFLILWYS